HSASSARAVSSSIFGCSMIGALKPWRSNRQAHCRRSADNPGVLNLDDPQLAGLEPSSVLLLRQAHGLWLALGQCASLRFGLRSALAGDLDRCRLESLMRACDKADSLLKERGKCR